MDENDSSPATEGGHASFPPTGYLTHDEAAARLGVHARTLREWVADGRLAYGGTTMRSPKVAVGRAGGGTRTVRVYSIDALEQAREEMRARESARPVPAGYLDRDETARFFGIAPDTLALWFTNGKIRCGEWIKQSNGKRAKVYPLAELERIRDAIAAENAARVKPPEGYTDIEGVCEMFGITRQAWINWKREGKVPRGEKWQSATQTYLRIYKIDELREVLDRLRGPDKVFVEGGGTMRVHVPDGWVQLREASAMFGVDPNTFLRWEREGEITCGKRETARRIIIFPSAELNRLLAENGRYEPPYPDPDRAGVYRVPLAGRAMQRVEALIDADDLPMVEGRRFHLSAKDEDGHACVAGSVDRVEMSLRTLLLGKPGEGCCISHRNDDPLDCRRANLVVRTRSDKGAAMRKAKSFCGRPTTSRFKGVCFDKKRERWVAYIKREQVSRSLGRYHDEIAAAEAYDAAAKELFGEHARLNFPDGVDARLEAEARDAEAAEAAEAAAEAESLQSAA